MKYTDVDPQCVQHQFHCSCPSESEADDWINKSDTETVLELNFWFRNTCYSNLAIKRTCKRTYSSGRGPPLRQPSVSTLTTKARPVFCSLLVAEVTCIHIKALTMYPTAKVQNRVEKVTLLYPWKCNLGRLLCTTNLLSMSMWSKIQWILQMVCGKKIDFIPTILTCQCWWAIGICRHIWETQKAKTQIPSWWHHTRS